MLALAWIPMWIHALTGCFHVLNHMTEQTIAEVFLKLDHICTHCDQGVQVDHDSTGRWPLQSVNSNPISTTMVTATALALPSDSSLGRKVSNASTTSSGAYSELSRSCGEDSTDSALYSHFIIKCNLNSSQTTTIPKVPQANTSFSPRVKITSHQSPLLQQPPSTIDIRTSRFDQTSTSTLFTHKQKDTLSVKEYNRLKASPNLTVTSYDFSSSASAPEFSLEADDDKSSNENEEEEVEEDNFEQDRNITDNTTVDYNTKIPASARQSSQSNPSPQVRKKLFDDASKRQIPRSKSEVNTIPPLLTNQQKLPRTMIIIDNWNNCL
ncbi:unnamed protein product [Didymodactylos carnosus]|uniref:Uncharacterized protein n=1 Tax=Didymodactylos carnosus TaxID=1234261 RepID=A0A814UR10_9BILA|nr:unnamed protein product [Didymodactylos carnosus]CAF1175465.1 unnamed protein product [Didymodactylos carnosus]CAF3675624.1 unnamed protein product [Didymodactylos carnosus]CAF3939454.1 unnamed protein product [Didymodactylos carnosus]